MQARTKEVITATATLLLIPLLPLLVKLEPFNAAVNPPSDCTCCCCCALMIIKLEAKKVTAIIAVNINVIAGEARTGEVFSHKGKKKKEISAK